MTKAQQQITFTGQKKNRNSVKLSHVTLTVFTWPDKMLEKCICNLKTLFRSFPPFIRPDRHIEVIVSIVPNEWSNTNIYTTEHNNVIKMNSPWYDYLMINKL